MTETSVTYSIDRVNVHGVNVPVVNHKKGPMILHRMLAEELGLSSDTFYRIIDRKNLGSFVITVITKLEVYKGRGAPSQGMEAIPLRKFETLLNHLDTARIGKTINQKDRAELVQDIENIQAEIRTVIEEYYHEGAAFNKRRVKTSAARDELVSAIEDNVDLLSVRRDIKELKDDVKRLNARIERLEEGQDVLIKSQGNLTKIVTSLAADVHSLVKETIRR